MKVHTRRERLASLGATALFVVHDEPAAIRRQLLDGLDDPGFPLLVDRDRRAYADWGLGRAPWWRVWLDPNVWRQYGRLLRRGHRLRGLGADPLQLGGDFVVDAHGTIAYARPQRRDDRPPVGELVSVLERLRGA